MVDQIAAPLVEDIIAAINIDPASDTISDSIQLAGRVPTMISGRLALACSLPALLKLKPDHCNTRGDRALGGGITIISIETVCFDIVNNRSDTLRAGLLS